MSPFWVSVRRYLMSLRGVTRPVNWVSPYWATVRRCLPWVPLTLAFAAVGYVTGWFVGVSQTPVVGTLIPLAFGLLGALTYGLLDRASKAQAITDRLEKELDGTAFFTAKAVVKEESGTSMNLAGFWAGGVLLFCLTCYLGVQAGISRLVPEYPSVAQLIGNAKASPKEMAALHTLRIHLQASHVPVEETEEIFRDTIRPIFAMKPPTTREPPRGGQTGGTVPAPVLQDDLTAEAFYAYTRPELIEQVVSKLLEAKRQVNLQRVLPYTAPSGQYDLLRYGGRPAAKITDGPSEE